MAQESLRVGTTLRRQSLKLLMSMTVVGLTACSATGGFGGSGPLILDDVRDWSEAEILPVRGRVAGGLDVLLPGLSVGDGREVRLTGFRVGFHEARGQDHLRWISQPARDIHGLSALCGGQAGWVRLDSWLREDAYGSLIGARVIVPRGCTLEGEVDEAARRLLVALNLRLMAGDGK